MAEPRKTRHLEPCPAPTTERSGVIARPRDLLIERAKRGDVEAIGEFLESHRNGLTGYFAGPMHWHWAFVADLVQETMTRAVRSFGRFRGEDRKQAARWLYGIARNVHMQEVSRQVGIRLRRDVAAQIARIQPRAASEGPYRGDIVAALATLPLPQLEALRLTLEGLTLREIASELDVPEGTVATRVHRARARLRLALGIGLE